MSLQNLSPPIVVEPIHALGAAVAIQGHVAGAELKVFRIQAQSGMLEQIGACTAPLSDVFSIQIPQLNMNDKVFAMQEIQANGQTVTSPDPPQKLLTAVLPHTPLASPYVRTPLYACARKIAVGNIVNGATVEVLRNGSQIFKGPIGYPHITIGVAPPLESGDRIYATQCFLDIPPSQSDTEEAKPYPKGRLPKPSIRSPLIECAPSFEVEDLIPGARLLLFDVQTGMTIGDVITGEPVHSVEVSGGLQRDWKLVAVQQLCGAEDRSPESDVVPVEEISRFGAYFPKFATLPEPGDSFVVVHGVHESTIRVVADGIDIGGGTCFGSTALHLDKPLAMTKLQLIQSLNCQDKEWEVVGGALPTTPAGSVLELSEGDYYSTIANSPLPVMVDFWWTECSPCREAKPHVEKLAKEYAGRVLIASLERVEYDPLSVHHYPAFAFFKPGNDAFVAMVYGWDEPKIRSELDKLIGP